MTTFERAPYSGTPGHSYFLGSADVLVTRQTAVHIFGRTVRIQWTDDKGERRDFCPSRQYAARLLRMARRNGRIASRVTYFLPEKES